MAAAQRRRRLNKLPGTNNHDDKTAEHSTRQTEPADTRSLWTPTSQRSLPLERAFRTSGLESRSEHVPESRSRNADGGQQCLVHAVGGQDAAVCEGAGRPG